jgi:aminoglycoside phosphotransferase (APT) family kinase protein
VGCDPPADMTAVRRPATVATPDTAGEAMAGAQERLRGIDDASVTAWIVDHVEGLQGPFTWELIAGGHSNLTYRGTDAAGRRFVLRRPPLSHVLPTAHDMAREYTIIAALGPTPVPVPPALALCQDTGVNGTPFYVMGYVEGHVMHNADVAREVYGEAERRAAGESFIDVLADLHTVDPDAVGLGGLGRKEGYVARQLKRWYGQFQQSKQREVPEIDRVHEFLAGRIPDEQRVSVVHGDYRLGNCLTAGDGHVAAVLDWEICTLGDPLADVGYALSYWQQPDDPVPTDANAPSLVPGFPSRAELLERYAARSGADLSGIEFYMAFSYWKLACIVEGVYSRYLGGALDPSDIDLDDYRDRVVRLARAAEVTAERV